MPITVATDKFSFPPDPSEKQKKQQQLWVLLGQVTSAQHWHAGLMNQLRREGMCSIGTQVAYDGFLEAMQYTEQKIRKAMKEL